MFSGRMWRCGVIAVALTLLVGGCATSHTDGEPSAEQAHPTGGGEATEPDGEPVDGGVLTIADTMGPESLDPAATAATGSTGGSVLAAIYDTLIRYDFATSSWQPQLAESLTSTDNVTWTLRLRPGVKFTNGTPLDADAVLASQKRYIDRYAYQALLLRDNIVRMKKAGPLTITYTLRRPWASFPDMLAQGPGMIPAPEAYKDAATFVPIGAGPFAVEKHKRREEALLDANPDYWGVKPHLDGLRFVWPGDGLDQPKLDALMEGQVDSALLRNSTVVEKARGEHLGGEMFAAGLTSNLWINTRKNHPGNDLRVRRALRYGLDVTAFVAQTRGDATIAATGLFSPESPWSPMAAGPGTDTTRAKALLGAAKADGYDGTITYLHRTDAMSTRQATVLKQMLDAVGFRVVLKPVKNESAHIKAMYVDHTFDLAMSATAIPDNDPYPRLAGVFDAKSPSNASGYSSSEMDKALAQLQSATDVAERSAAAARIETLWYRDVPGIGITAGGSFQAWRSNVHDVRPTTEEMTLYDRAWKG